MTDYPNDEDGMVLADLASQGVDMTQPMEIEFPVLTVDEASANAIAKALVEAGYEAFIEFDEGEPDEDGIIDPDDEEFGPAWDIYVTVKMVPTYDEIVRIQDDLTRIASPFGGLSDGWGVMLEDDYDDE
ncbi:ribonuclease E inhibitor RraB [Stieleria varia]|uniref:Regulator of ribonuclease activity B domain-containing protein n=1 Tax=Stieleria varia TaxID=2528005 RepID=A0A5C6A2X9_9BACT|nr:ribonuclease E inhibitor RraB [Stieleria varia]TWT93756.1 hypothetical protein Pla52n_55840 [Stieleria varia]